MYTHPLCASYFYSIYKEIVIKMIMKNHLLTMCDYNRREKGKTYDLSHSIWWNSIVSHHSDAENTYNEVHAHKVQLFTTNAIFFRLQKFKLKLNQLNGSTLFLLTNRYQLWKSNPGTNHLIFANQLIPRNGFVKTFCQSLINQINAEAI